MTCSSDLAPIPNAESNDEIAAIEKCESREFLPSVVRTNPRARSKSQAGHRPSGSRPSAGETPSTSAASLTVRPAKKRSLTNSAVSGSVRLEQRRGPRRGRQVVGPLRRSPAHQVEVDAGPTAAVLAASLAAGVLDQDAPHGLGRRGEEMAAAVPIARASRSDQPQVRLVDQGGGLERLPGLLLRQPLGGQLAQLVVDQRQELLGGLGVALLDRREDASDVVHGGCSPRARAS